MFAAAHSQGQHSRRLRGAVGDLKDRGMIPENTTQFNRRMNRFRLLNAIEAASERARLRREQESNGRLQRQNSQWSMLAGGAQGASGGSGAGANTSSMGSHQFASVRSERRSSAEMYQTRSLFGRIGSLAQQQHLSRTEKIWNFFSDPTSSGPAWVFGIVVFALIIVSCVSFILESIPDLCCGRYDSILEPIEAVCIAFFTVEYLGRLCSVPWYWPEDRQEAMERLEEEELMQREEDARRRQVQVQRALEERAREEQAGAAGEEGEGDKPGEGSERGRKQGGEAGAEGPEPQAEGGRSVLGLGGAGFATMQAMTALGWRRRKVHPSEGAQLRAAKKGRVTTWRKRVGFASGLMNVVDLVAIIPFYVELVLKATMGREATNLSWLRVLRLVRVFRVLKISKYSEGLHLLTNTMARSARTLMMLMLFECIAVVLLSSAVYFAERGVWCDAENDFCAHTGEDFGSGWYASVGAYAGSTYTEGCRSAAWCRQRSKFENILVSGYWCIQTMTTTGYGDLVPLTVVGKLVGCVTMLLGLVLIALPITVISENFAQEYQQLQLEQLQAAEEQWLIAESRWLGEDGSLAGGTHGQQSSWGSGGRSGQRGEGASTGNLSGSGSISGRGQLGSQGSKMGDGGEEVLSGMAEQGLRDREAAGMTGEVPGEEGHAGRVSGHDFGGASEISEGRGAGGEEAGAGRVGSGVAGEREDLLREGSTDSERRWRRRLSWGSEEDQAGLHSAGAGAEGAEAGAGEAGEVGEAGEAGRGGVESHGVGLFASTGPPASALVSTRQQLSAPPDFWAEEEAPGGRGTRGKAQMKRGMSGRGMTPQEKGLERKLAELFLEHRQKIFQRLEDKLVSSTELLLKEIEREQRRVAADAAAGT